MEKLLLNVINLKIDDSEKISLIKEICETTKSVKDTQEKIEEMQDEIDSHHDKINDLEYEIEFQGEKNETKIDELWDTINGLQDTINNLKEETEDHEDKIYSLGGDFFEFQDKINILMDILFKKGIVSKEEMEGEQKEESQKGEIEK